MQVAWCPLEDPDADLLPAMAVVAAATAEQWGGLPPKPAERELAARRVPDPGIRSRLLVAGDRADPDGVGDVAFELDSNTHLAHVDVWVPGDRRRRGVGSLLLAAAEDAARAGGRSLAMAQTESPAPSGRAFFQARGYTAAFVAHCSRLLLDQVDRSLLARWTADPDPVYDLVLVDGRAPDELVAPLLQASMAMNDAPIEDLEVEDDVLSAERLRALEAILAAAGERRWTYLAVHRTTGKGAGFTAVRWDPVQPSVVWQRGTAVTAAHRGHRLGRRLKAAMLLHVLAAACGAREVRTENAGTNTHMLAINDALGFAPWAEQVVLQKHL